MICGVLEQDDLEAFVDCKMKFRVRIPQDHVVSYWRTWSLILAFWVRKEKNSSDYLVSLPELLSCDQSSSSELKSGATKLSTGTAHEGSKPTITDHDQMGSVIRLSRYWSILLERLHDCSKLR